jgi:hypothetical protein
MGFGFLAAIPAKAESILLFAPQSDEKHHFVILAKAGFSFAVAVIPAEAGIHLLWMASREPTHVRVSFVRHPGGRVTFFCLSKRR